MEENRIENQINTDTVEDQVYHIIHNKIHLQILKPGCRINENKIAEELHVSRSPVREALNRLKGDGLVVTVPNKGSFVRKITAGDVREMYQARVMFEVFALENLALLPTPEQKAHLTEIFAKMITAFAAQEVAEYLLLDRELHTGLVGLCNNRYILDLYNKLNWQINVFRTEKGWDNDFFMTIHDEHLRLRDHLLNDDFHAVAVILPLHINRGLMFIIDQMQ